MVGNNKTKSIESTIQLPKTLQSDDQSPLITHSRRTSADLHIMRMMVRWSNPLWTMTFTSPGHRPNSCYCERCMRIRVWIMVGKRAFWFYGDCVVVATSNRFANTEYSLKGRDRKNSKRCNIIIEYEYNLIGINLIVQFGVVDPPKQSGVRCAVVFAVAPYNRA